MASSVVQVDEFALIGFSLARMEEAEPGLVAPNASGYSVINVSDSQSTFVVDEACVGFYRWILEDVMASNRFRGGLTSKLTTWGHTLLLAALKSSSKLG